MVGVAAFSGSLLARNWFRQSGDSRPAHQRVPLQGATQTRAVGRTNTVSGFGSEPNTFLNNLASLDACPGFAVNTSRMISMIVPPFIVNAFCNEAQQLRNETFSSRQASVADYLSYRPVQTSEVPFLQQSDEQQSGTHQ